MSDIDDLIQQDPREPFLDLEDLDSILDCEDDWEDGVEDFLDEDDGDYERPLNKDEIDEARGEFNKRGEDGDED